MTEATIGSLAEGRRDLIMKFYGKEVDRNIVFKEVLRDLLKKKK